MNDTPSRTDALNSAYTLGMIQLAATEALRWYATYMRENAAGAQLSYDQISADPEAAARQDESMMTTNGLRHSAQIFREAADRADETLGAFMELAGDPDELAYFHQRHGYVLTNALTVQAEHVREDGDAATADAADMARLGYEALAEDDDEDEEPLDAGFQD
jgi:hypothetical protein